MSRALVLTLGALLGVPALAGAWPTPGLNLGPRIVPEARETNDFIGYAEARAMLDAIAEEAPDFVEVVEVGQSFGWRNTVTGSHDTFPVLAVEVTDEASAVPRGEKEAIVFQLSIHGNEKGGREGGLRVIEDLAIPRLYGEEYRDLLQRVIVVFTFPNVDGWMHEELPYRANCPDYFALPPGFLPNPTGRCVESQSYVRSNGHGQDLNRDWPTLGWYETRFGRENALSEPETQALERYLAEFKGRTVAATDIHGMLNPADGGVNVAGDTPLPVNLIVGNQANGAKSYCFPENPAGLECAREGHFVLGLLQAAQADPALNLRNVRLAERSKEYLNRMAAEQFPYWTSAPNAGAAGGSWMEWGTVWDTIGYTDSGFTGDFFAQFLGAAGLDYELSYNHVTFDNNYVPELNAMHVESVRAIVRAFLDEAREEVQPALRVEGSIAVLGDERVVASDDGLAQEGPHLAAAEDDAYEQGYAASPQRFWDELARFAPPGGIARVSAEDVAQGRFHAHRTLVIPGDAWELIAEREDALAHLRMHLEQGKRLVLTDSALRALEALGLAAPGSVEEGKAYLGHVDLDHESPLAAGVRGLARQTYDAIPLGYAVPNAQGDELTAPVWTVKAEALEGAEVAGTTLGEGRASLGLVRSGEGEVVFLGALLPTPTEASYHPYGLADYAVTYTGYQLLYNALGVVAEERSGPLDEPGLGPTAAPEEPRRGIPEPGPVLGALAAAGAAILAAGRRRRA